MKLYCPGTERKGDTVKKQKNQVSLAGVVKQKETSKKKKKSGNAAWIVLLVLAILVGGFFVGRNIYKKATAGPSLTAREMIQYTPTADKLSGKVAYFVLGVTGDKPTNRMDMVAVMCYDRRADKVSILQMPVTTYIEKDRGFGTSILGDVWAKPQQLSVCTTCRCNVATDAIENGKHKACGTKIEKQPGSSFSDLCRVINTQYGLPTDNYLVVPREGLAMMIDKLGGVDIALDRKRTMAGKTYAKGIHTMSGAEAVHYAFKYDYDGTLASDRARMLRQRQVLTALLQRLGTKSVDELFNSDNTSLGVVSSVMNSGSPVRFDTTTFGKARLLGYSEARVEDIRFSKTLAMFCREIGRLELADITCAMLPGDTARKNSTTLYSVNKEQLKELLESHFLPYGVTGGTTFDIPTLKDNPAEADLAITTLDTLAIEQNGDLNATTGG